MLVGGRGGGSGGQLGGGTGSMSSGHGSGFGTTGSLRLYKTLPVDLVVPVEPTEGKQQAQRRADALQVGSGGLPSRRVEFAPGKQKALRNLLGAGVVLWLLST